MPILLEVHIYFYLFMGDSPIQSIFFFMIKKNKSNIYYMIYLWEGGHSVFFFMIKKNKSK